MRPDVYETKSFRPYAQARLYRRVAGGAFDTLIVQDTRNGWNYEYRIFEQENGERCAIPVESETPGEAFQLFSDTAQKKVLALHADFNAK